MKCKATRQSTSGEKIEGGSFPKQLCTDRSSEDYPLPKTRTQLKKSLSNSSGSDTEKGIKSSVKVSRGSYSASPCPDSGFNSMEASDGSSQDCVINASCPKVYMNVQDALKSIPCPKSFGEESTKLQPLVCLRSDDPLLSSKSCSPLTVEAKSGVEAAPSEAESSPSSETVENGQMKLPSGVLWKQRMLKQRMRNKAKIAGKLKKVSDSSENSDTVGQKELIQDSYIGEELKQDSSGAQNLLNAGEQESNITNHKEPNCSPSTKPTVERPSRATTTLALAIMNLDAEEMEAPEKSAPKKNRRSGNAPSTSRAKDGNANEFQESATNTTTDTPHEVSSPSHKAGNRAGGKNSQVSPSGGKQCDISDGKQEGDLGNVHQEHQEDPKHGEVKSDVSESDGAKLCASSTENGVSDKSDNTTSLSPEGKQVDSSVATNKQNIPDNPSTPTLSEGLVDFENFATSPDEKKISPHVTRSGRKAGRIVLVNPKRDRSPRVEALSPDKTDKLFSPKDEKLKSNQSGEVTTDVLSSPPLAIKGIKPIKHVPVKSQVISPAKEGGAIGSTKTVSDTETEQVSAAPKQTVTTEKTASSSEITSSESAETSSEQVNSTSEQVIPSTSDHLDFPQSPPEIVKQEECSTRDILDEIDAESIKIEESKGAPCKDSSLQIKASQPTESVNCEKKVEPGIVEQCFKSDIDSQSSGKVIWKENIGKKSARIRDRKHKKESITSQFAEFDALILAGIDDDSDEDTYSAIVSVSPTKEQTYQIPATSKNESPKTTETLSMSSPSLKRPKRLSGRVPGAPRNVRKVEADELSKYVGCIDNVARGRESPTILQNTWKSLDSMWARLGGHAPVDESPSDQEGFVWSSSGTRGSAPNTPTIPVVKATSTGPLVKATSTGPPPRVPATKLEPSPVKEFDWPKVPSLRRSNISSTLLERLSKSNADNQDNETVQSNSAEDNSLLTPAASFQKELDQFVSQGEEKETDSGPIMNSSPKRPKESRVQKSRDSEAPSNENDTKSNTCVENTITPAPDDCQEADKKDGPVVDKESVDNAEETCKKSNVEAIPQEKSEPSRVMDENSRKVTDPCSSDQKPESSTEEPASSNGDQSPLVSSAFKSSNDVRLASLIMKLQGTIGADDSEEPSPDVSFEQEPAESEISNEQESSFSSSSQSAASTSLDESKENMSFESEKNESAVQSDTITPKEPEPAIPVHNETKVSTDEVSEARQDNNCETKREIPEKNPEAGKEITEEESEAKVENTDEKHATVSDPQTDVPYDIKPDPVVSNVEPHEDPTSEGGMSPLRLDTSEDAIPPLEMNNSGASDATSHDLPILSPYFLDRERKFDMSGSDHQSEGVPKLDSNTPHNSIVDLTQDSPSKAPPPTIDTRETREEPNSIPQDETSQPSQEVDQALVVFEKPGDPQIKKKSAFMSDELESYLSSSGNKTINSEFVSTDVLDGGEAAYVGEKADAIHVEPEMDEVGGVTFMSFPSEQALVNHKSKTVGEKSPGKTSNISKIKGWRKKFHQSPAKPVKQTLTKMQWQNLTHYLKPCSEKVIQNLGLSLKQNDKSISQLIKEKDHRDLEEYWQRYGRKIVTQSPESETSMMNDPDYEEEEEEEKPSVCRIYGRKSGGRFASKVTMKYRASPKSKCRLVDLNMLKRKGRKPDTFYEAVYNNLQNPVQNKKVNQIEPMFVTHAMAVKAVSALQVEGGSDGGGYDEYDDDEDMCSKPGCRYGCVCHICEMDSPASSEPFQHEGGSCDKEYCRLGCICDSLDSAGKTKPKTVTNIEVMSEFDSGVRNLTTCFDEETDEGVRKSKRLKNSGSSAKALANMKSLIFFDAYQWYGEKKRKKEKGRLKSPTIEHVAAKNYPHPKGCARVATFRNLRRSPKSKRLKESPPQQCLYSDGYGNKTTAPDPQSTQAAPEPTPPTADKQAPQAKFRVQMLLLQRKKKSPPKPTEVRKEAVDGEEAKSRTPGAAGNQTDVQDKNSDSLKNETQNRENSDTASAEQPKSSKLEVGENTESTQKAPEENQAPSALKTEAKTDDTMQTLSKTTDKKSEADEDTPHLLEIHSNCDWENIRSELLGKISVLADGVDYPVPATFGIASFVVDILPRPNNKTPIPKSLQKRLKKEFMFAIKIKVTQRKAEVNDPPTRSNGVTEFGTKKAIVGRPDSVHLRREGGQAIVTPHFGGVYSHSAGFSGISGLKTFVMSAPTTSKPKVPPANSSIPEPVVACQDNLPLDLSSKPKTDSAPPLPAKRMLPLPIAWVKEHLVLFAELSTQDDTFFNTYAAILKTVHTAPAQAAQLGKGKEQDTRVAFLSEDIIKRIFTLRKQVKQIGRVMNNTRLAKHLESIDALGPTSEEDGVEALKKTLMERASTVHAGSMQNKSEQVCKVPPRRHSAEMVVPRTETRESRCKTPEPKTEEVIDLTDSPVRVPRDRPAFVETTKASLPAASAVMETTESSHPATSAAQPRPVFTPIEQKKPIPDEPVRAPNEFVAIPFRFATKRTSPNTGPDPAKIRRLESLLPKITPAALGKPPATWKEQKSTEPPQTADPATSMGKGLEGDQPVWKTKDRSYSPYSDISNGMCSIDSSDTTGDQSRASSRGAGDIQLVTKLEDEDSDVDVVSVAPSLSKPPPVQWVEYKPAPKKKRKRDSTSLYDSERKRALQHNILERQRRLTLCQELKKLHRMTCEDQDCSELKASKVHTLSAAVLKIKTLELVQRRNALMQQQLILRNEALLKRKDALMKEARASDEGFGMPPLVEEDMINLDSDSSQGSPLVPEEGADQAVIDYELLDADEEDPIVDV